MSARSTTSAQTLLADVAMAIYRRCGFTLHHVKHPHLMEEPVAREVATYVSRSVEDSGRMMARMVTAALSQTIRVESTGCMTGIAWLQKLVTPVIVREIQRIVSTQVYFWEQVEPHWIFLGRDRRDLKALPLGQSERERATRPAGFGEIVDLWGSSDGTQVKVVYDVGVWDYVPAHIDDLDRAGPHVREAFRRLALHLLHRQAA